MSPRRARQIQYPDKHDSCWDIPMRDHACPPPPAILPLVEFSPRFRRGDLVFDCPACCCTKAHAIRVALPESEERPDVHELTVNGVIDVGCWRGRITGGQIVSEK